jgi:uncharacterized membrane protein
MVRRNPIDPEERKLFEGWGVKRVRQMMAAGHFEAKLRRPMANWLAERDARASKWRQLAIIAAIVLALATLFAVVWSGAGSQGVL